MRRTRFEPIRRPTGLQGFFPSFRELFPLRLAAKMRWKRPFFGKKRGLVAYSCSGDLKQDAVAPPAAHCRAASAIDPMEVMLESLLERLRRPGDEEAWDRFIELISPLLFAWTRRMWLSQQDAADLVQDVLTILVQELPTFNLDRQKSFGGWLKTVTWNKWYERHRRRPTEFLDHCDPRLRDLPERQVSETFWEIEYRTHLAARAIEFMQAEFQPDTWRACWEYVVSGRSATEVAEELGMTLGAVYAAKSRVLKRLRVEFEGLLD